MFDVPKVALRRLLLHELMRESALIAAAQAIVILLGVANSAVLARLLSADQFGYYQFLLSWVAIAAAGGLPGMATSLLKSTLKDYDRFYWLAIRRSLLASNISAMLVAAVGAIGYWGDTAWKDSALVMLLVAVGMPFAGIQNYESVFVGRRDFRASRLLQIISSTLLLLATGMAAWIYGSGVYAFVGYTLVRFAIAITAFTMIQRRLVDCPRDPTYEAELLAQGWRQTALSFFILVASRLDRVVLGSISPAMLAQYHVGTLIPASIKNNSKLFMAVLGSHWGKLDAKENAKALKQNSLKFFAVGVAAFMASVLAIHLAIPLIFGVEYRPSVWVGTIFALSLIPAFWSHMRGLEDQIQGDGRSNQLAQVVRYVVQIGCVLAFAPHGIYWVAFVTPIADLTFMATSLWRPAQSTTRQNCR